MGPDEQDYFDYHGKAMFFLGTHADFVLQGRADWPSFSYWMIPGTELED
jgi:hypothetical protein